SSLYIFYNSKLVPDAVVPIKETDARLFACLYFPFSLFKDLFSALAFRFWALKTRSFPNGIAKVQPFSESPNFFEEIFKEIFKIFYKALIINTY
ncbi:MAG: hypothetical protein IKO31_07595, partial [Bacteroidales bacterium]|nr:hypothetical protein [Bacteroidales bacterium]